MIPRIDESMRICHPVILVLLLGAGPFGTGTVAAQTAPLRPPISRPMLEQLRLADQALAAGNPDSALEIFQDLLDGRLDRVVVASPSEPGRRIGVRRHVLEQIESRGLLDRYRQLMEPRARHLVGEPDSADMGLLEAGLRRFPLTETGQASARALLSNLTECGRLDDARMLAARLADEGLLAEDDPLRLGVLVLALHGTGREDELVDLARRHGDCVIGLGGASKTLAEFLAALTDGRPKSAAAARLPGGKIPYSWGRVFAKNRDRGGRPRRTGGMGRDDDTWSDPDHLPVRPVLTAQAVFACDGLSLGGFNRKDGRPLWAAFRTIDDGFLGARDLALEYEVLLDGDLLFAYLQGEPMFSATMWFRGGAVVSHQLVALDPTTGRARWSHLACDRERDKEDPEGFLARLSVCQVPLPIGDRLYVSGCTFDGVFLDWVCALERDTGRLIWRSFMGEGQTVMGRASTPRRAPITGPLVEHEGVLYHCTNLGAVAAIDATSGATLWHSDYPRDGEEDIDFDGSTRSRRRGFEPETRPWWMPAAPIVDERQVAFAPTDSMSILAVDLRDGRLHRVTGAASTTGERFGRLLAFENDRILVSHRTIRCCRQGIDAVDWTFPAAGDGEWLVGRPWRRGGRLYFSTTGNVSRAYELDTATGAVQAIAEIGVEGDRAGHLDFNAGGVVMGSANAILFFKDP